MLWQSHSNFEIEFKKIARRIRDLDDGLSKAKKLLEKQFHPTDPVQIIAPAKIHRIHAEEVWELWKLEMQVKNLRPSQFPRVWFAVSGNTITFLVVGSHMQNYDNNAMDRCAVERYSEIA